MNFISEPGKWNRGGIVQEITAANKSRHGLYGGQTHLCF